MSVEKAVGKIRYKNSDKYLRWSNIAALMESMLNTAAGRAMFKVYSDSNTAPVANEPYVCTLKMRIEPSALRGSGSEVIDIRLTCKIPIEVKGTRELAVNVLNKVLGAMSGTFNVTEYGETMEYSFFSNFRLNETTTPENINSKFVTAYVLEGKMSVMRSTGGAVLSDTVKTYISIPDGFLTIAEGDYEIVARSVQGAWQAIIDSPVKAGNMQAETEYTAISSTKSLVVLFRNDEICNLILDFINGDITAGQNPFIDEETGKGIITIKEEYPFKTVTKNYYINSITNNRELGTYVSFVISLSAIPSAATSTEPQEEQEESGITFTLAGTTYQVESGMTWGEWVESVYNIDGYYISGGQVYWASSGNTYRVVGSGIAVGQSDVISDGGQYSITLVGSSF